MIIVEPYAKMLPSPGYFIPGGNIEEQKFTEDMGWDAIRHVEWCSRISHRSEDKITADSWKRIIQHVVIEHGDWSVTEHATVTVDAVVDRGITHEWVRHRLAAYTQESTRFVNYAKKNTQTQEYTNPAKFICPPSILATKKDRRAEGYGDTGSLVHDGDSSIYATWVRGREADEQEYMEYLNRGIKPQEARTCFPNALAARIVSTYNLRMWRHFFIMRATQEAHPQMKQVTIPLLEEFKRNIPLLYDDIEPNEKQSIAMKKAR